MTDPRPTARHGIAQIQQPVSRSLQTSKIKPAEQLANYATVPGLIYAGLLVAFAAMPILLNRPAPPAGPQT